MSFKRIILHSLLGIHGEVEQMRKELRRMKKTMSGNYDNLKSSLDQINAATNEAAVEVETLASLLQQALNRSDMTAEEEQALIDQATGAIAGSTGLVERLKSIAADPNGPEA